SSMGIIIQEDDAITQHAKVFASYNFTMSQCLFLFSEFEGTLIWNKVSSENSLKTIVENWLNGQDGISAKPG
ncbi:hypothetical protein AVEN_163889-1, partial [Araneus ventricosus]